MSVFPKYASSQLQEMRARHEATWNALTPEDGVCYLQMLDLAIGRAGRAGVNPTSAMLLVTSGLAVHYERFILLRRETPQDDWYALPPYKGWRIDTNFSHDRDLGSVDSVCVSPLEGGNKARARLEKKLPDLGRVFLAARPLSPSALEIYQRLAYDHGGEFDPVELTETASLLDR